ncbi:formate dehydrogenase accessory sulfurtransferase FdhD [Propioniciclava coleopterorum]|uniref:Sulfur carrier protein FdhD n=1 Tax=Propioniciclava coleopterorum TaxID=2714937 RepID=A0A6G7Y2U8_9ACTN|nr:formate dehydrogenase accessory sulfurtransferase FdhD [Propioniciclava coleopterorum]QIK71132.1 formate dehydrogenase accessory sulfurtransferase FdhD [Propioniciclava coleopterorum]
MAPGIVRRPVTVVGDAPPRAADSVAVEEPLELRSGGRVLTLTMRTPGHDLELAHGWLHAEGYIAERSDVLTARFARSEPEDATLATPGYNVLEVTLAGTLPPPRSVTVTSSACGACGSASLDALVRQGRFDVAADATQLDARVLVGLPAALREHQHGFAGSGGLHAAGLFTATGRPLVVREDVGRHNAVDKVIGWALLQESLPLHGVVLQVSGRASFELVQKAVRAGLPVLSAVSAPSSLAVDLAERAGMTLAGFVREGRATLYTRPDRVRA